MQLIEFVVQGLGIGALYGLIALPLSLVYVTTGCVDIAAGGYAVVAGVMAGAVGGVVGVLAGLGVAVALSLLMGAVFVLLRRRGNQDPITPSLASLGLATAIAGAVLWHYGPDARVMPLFESGWKFGGLPVNPHSVLNLVFVLLTLAACLLVIYRTPVGSAMRACAANADDAGLVGIAVTKVQIIVFGVGGLLSGTAGILFLMARGVSFDYAVPLSLLGFGALIVFGMRGPASAVAGGLVLGVVEGLSAGYLSSEYSLIAPQVFILAVLAKGAFDTQAVARA